MSEMEWEQPPPEVCVRRVRPWVIPALRDWTRAVYPPRRGVTIVWGCLFVVPWAIFQAIKFWVWLIGVMFVLAVYPPYVLVELITYHSRYQRAVIAQWGPYMQDLYGEDPPPSIAA